MRLIHGHLRYFRGKVCDKNSLSTVPWHLANDTTNLLFHHVLLFARYHIYFSKQKGFNPSWGLFFRTFLTCQDYESRYAVKTGILSKFNARWGAFIREYDL